MYNVIKRSRRIIIDIIAAFGGVFIVALLLWAAYYNTRFYPDTRIEGVDCSGLTVAQAESRLTAQLMERRVEILSQEGKLLLSVSLSEIYSGSTPLAQCLGEMMSAQQSCFWGLFSGGRYEYSLQWPDADALMPVISAAAAGQHVAAVNAAIVETSGGWTITASANGSLPDSAASARMLADILSAGNNGANGAAIRLSLGGTAVEPTVREDSAHLVRHLTTIDETFDVSITIDFGAGLEHTLSYKQLRQLYDINISGETLAVVYMPEQLRNVVDAVIEQMNADGVGRKYGVIDQEKYYYDETWDQGFVLDRDDLYSQIDNLLASGKSGTVKAKYDYTSCLTAHYDHEWIEDTYIEISIDNQYMWYYVDGELLVETPIVTGCVATGDDTRKGVFYVVYLDERAYLSGGSSNKGAGYFVDYWMPFDGNIGLHDAQWVTEFGGDIYLENGSHGCVNTPFEAMKTIFENCERFCTVVVR